MRTTRTKSTTSDFEAEGRPTRRFHVTQRVITITRETGNAVSARQGPAGLPSGVVPVDRGQDMDTLARARATRERAHPAPDQ
jgi:hypothetical protein